MAHFLHTIQSGYKIAKLFNKLDRFLFCFCVGKQQKTLLPQTTKIRFSLSAQKDKITLHWLAKIIASFCYKFFLKKNIFFVSSPCSKMTNWLSSRLQVDDWVLEQQSRSASGYSLSFSTARLNGFLFLHCK